MKGLTVWLTGLPCSGKTTISCCLLDREFRNFVWLDGDNMRTFVDNQGFSEEDRRRHLLYVSFICKVMNDRGINVICAFVSPTNKIRSEIKEKIGKDRFIEVFINASKDDCIERDVKGMWAKAISGDIRGFTGHDGIWEPPESPDVIVDSSTSSIAECSQIISEYFFNSLIDKSDTKQKKET